MAYPPQLLEDVRQRLSLSQIVGKHVRLQKRGRDFVGLCPFHNEKTPSFNVVEDKQFYHCFGCGAHGDVIGFTMRIGNTGFREAVEDLAKLAGVELPKETPQAAEEFGRREKIHAACISAMELFKAQLWSPAGSAGLSYLRGRGLSDETIHQFRLGWAPDSRSFLRDTLTRSHSDEVLAAAGLIKEGDRGTYDFFRGRIIFPISDRGGRPIAFGGRIIGKGEPKYLNSPDTEIFSKRRTLFGLHLTRPAVSKEAVPIVVEGYMDVITLHEAGFRTAVAPLGTALTEEQLNELWKISDRPVLCFDGDAAGQRAAARALENALPALLPNKSISFVTLEGGEDPDSLIRSYGRSAFAQALDSSIEASEFLWNLVTGGQRPKTAERLAQTRHLLEEKIASIANRTVQISYQTILRSRLWEIYRSSRAASGIGTSRKPPETFFNVVRDIKVSFTRNKICNLLIAYAINHPRLLESDIDKFADLRPQARASLELHQDILQLVSDDPDISGEALLDILWDKHEKQLALIFNSNIYRTMLTAHPHAGWNEVALGWEGLTNRLLVFELQKELDVLLEDCKDGMTQESKERFELHRAGYLYHRSEEHLMTRERARVDLRCPWHPPKGLRPATDMRTSENHEEALV